VQTVGKGKGWVLNADKKKKGVVVEKKDRIRSLRAQKGRVYQSGLTDRSQGRGRKKDRWWKATGSDGLTINAVKQTKDVWPTKIKPIMAT